MPQSHPRCIQNGTERSALVCFRRVSRLLHLLSLLLLAYSRKDNSRRRAHLSIARRELTRAIACYCIENKNAYKRNQDVFFYDTFMTFTSKQNINIFIIIAPSVRFAETRQLQFKESRRDSISGNAGSVTRYFPSPTLRRGKKPRRGEEMHAKPECGTDAQGEPLLRRVAPYIFRDCLSSIRAIPTGNID